MGSQKAETLEVWNYQNRDEVSVMEQGSCPPVHCGKLSSGIQATESLKFYSNSRWDVLAPKVLFFCKTVVYSAASPKSATDSIYMYLNCCMTQLLNVVLC